VCSSDLENQIAVARAVIKSGRFDAMLISYNAFIGERVGPVLEEAVNAGLGTIIMKSLQPVHGANESEIFKGLKGSPYQRAIQWVLRNPNVSTVIVDMPTFDELEQDVAAVTGAVSTAQIEEFEMAVATIAAGTCHLCGACTGQCPAGVRVADIMRYVLYHDGYGDKSRALGLYRALPVSSTAAACADCGKCKAVCPWGVQVRSRMERAHAVLA
jgi:predicted aldo/keto reductase-like oxidoreductase